MGQGIDNDRLPETVFCSAIVCREEEGREDLDRKITLTVTRKPWI